MAVHDLKELQRQADALKPEEQIQLAAYLLAKARKVRAGEEALLSELVLAKDWLRPEEDQAWANL
ncbi:DUF2281 domain-containing protein [Fimbriimonadia bacterium ATM]|nr:MAG: DUF2281 domain-containing protein [Armatimonadota bacterium]MBC6968379.1 DUF2281 domain-containing protein [Armatimonadota bacterium]MCE7898783.1 DUF2281 domain-containing protein [Armatimonadetes bacterium ATM1]MDL1928720.1 DUF2281 domain-containing protein [Fimbriimonadia bacterium ATM]RIJ98500.1 MAG: DUF2281 domain-containing protein [Armatimonadota bacterium]